MIRAFTLVEMLVVVVVLGILAAVAVPNYLDAQTRSKVARVRSDARTVATALEAYATDSNGYPVGNAFGLAMARPSLPGDVPVLERLTTPVAYLAGKLPATPFAATRYSGPNVTGFDSDMEQWNVADWPAVDPGGADAPLYGVLQYTAVRLVNDTLTGYDRSLVEDAVDPDNRAVGYVIQSPGPQRAHINLGGVVANATRAYAAALLYDPTNGTASFGAILRMGGQMQGGDDFSGLR